MAKFVVYKSHFIVSNNLPKPGLGDLVLLFGIWSSLFSEGSLTSLLHPFEKNTFS